LVDHAAGVVSERHRRFHCGLGGIADRFGFEAGFWRVIGGLNENFGTLGCVIVAVFAASWVASMLVYRPRATVAARRSLDAPRPPRAIGHELHAALSGLHRGR
jgi:phage shock protein PspC (stress-responsive transcriptional regulator)